MHFLAGLTSDTATSVARLGCYPCPLSVCLTIARLLSRHLCLPTGLSCIGSLQFWWLLLPYHWPWDTLERRWYVQIPSLQQTGGTEHSQTGVHYLKWPLSGCCAGSGLDLQFARSVFSAAQLHTHCILWLADRVLCFVLHSGSVDCLACLSVVGFTTDAAAVHSGERLRTERPGDLNSWPPTQHFIQNTKLISNGPVFPDCLLCVILVHQLAL